MRIKAYRVLHAEDIPPLLFVELDTLNDHFLAAFEGGSDESASKRVTIKHTNALITT